MINKTWSRIDQIANIISLSTQNPTKNINLRNRRTCSTYLHILLIYSSGALRIQTVNLYYITVEMNPQLDQELLSGRKGSIYFYSKVSLTAVSMRTTRNADPGSRELVAILEIVTRNINKYVFSVSHRTLVHQILKNILWSPDLKNLD